jgi:hypothetical protein
MVDSVRALTLGSDAPRLLGHSDTYFITGALAWTVAIALVSIPLAIWRYGRT